MPHTKHRLSPSDVLRFDWDKIGKEDEMAAPASREDFERMRERFGGE